MVPSYLVCIIIYFPAVVVVAYVQYCGGQTSDQVIHMRRLGLSSRATVRDKKGTTKSVESSLLLFQNKHYLQVYYSICINKDLDMVGGVCKLTESDSKWPENVIFFVGLSGFFY